MGDFLEFLWEEVMPALVLTIVFISVFVGIMFGTVYLIGKNVACPRAGQALEMPHKYDFWAGGCFIQMDNGQWIRVENYRGANIEK